MKVTGFQSLIKTISDLKDRTESLASKADGVIVENSQFVTVDNKIPALNKVATTDEEARHDARYDANRKGQKFTEPDGISPEELANIKEEMIQRFVNEFISKAFK